jgi:hypothetical protein
MANNLIMIAAYELLLKSHMRKTGFRKIALRKWRLKKETATGLETLKPFLEMAKNKKRPRSELLGQLGEGMLPSN